MAAVPIHVAKMQFVAVNTLTGQILNKDNPQNPIMAFLNTKHEHCMIADSNLPNTVGTASGPSDLVKYLQDECTDGYILSFLGQNLVITYQGLESAVGVHVAYLQLFPVDALGNVINKNNPETTIAQMLQSYTEHRVIYDILIPNSINNPSIANYLASEAGDGFVLNHLDQTMIITYGG